MANTRKTFAIIKAEKVIVSGLKSMIVKETIFIFIRIPIQELHLT